MRNPKKHLDCRTDLIGGGGNTDVCPGRQTPSRRHCGLLSSNFPVDDPSVRTCVGRSVQCIVEKRGWDPDARGPLPKLLWADLFSFQLQLETLD